MSGMSASLSRMRRSAIMLADSMKQLAQLTMEREDIDDDIKLAEKALAELRRKGLLLVEKIEKQTKETDELSKQLAQHTTEAALEARR